MRWIFIAMATGATLGCTGGAACDTEAATRCPDGAGEVETCLDGRWTVTIDCAAAGQECMQVDGMMEGEAHCMGMTM